MGKEIVFVFLNILTMLISSCYQSVFGVNFVVFRLLYQKILFFLSFLLSCKYYFFIFFLFPDFSSISLLLFYQFWTKLIFWKIILGSILWLVHNVSPLYKLEGNNWSKCNNSSSVHKNCLMFMNMTYSYQFFYFLLFYIVFC